jgi:hypothetical protein
MGLYMDVGYDDQVAVSVWTEGSGQEHGNDYGLWGMVTRLRSVCGQWVVGRYLNVYVECGDQERRTGA